MSFSDEAPSASETVSLPKEPHSTSEDYQDICLPILRPTSPISATSPSNSASSLHTQSTSMNDEPLEKQDWYWCNMSR